jgi:mono/diheme cytochrome c family protein
MERSHNKDHRVFIGVLVFAVLSLVAMGTYPWTTRAAEETKTEAAEPAKTDADNTAKDKPAEGAAAADKATGETASDAGGEECCKAGDQTPPLELVAKVPPGKLHSPYQDYAEVAKDKDLVKQFRLPGCNECHGGTGGGGFCPALTQGVWFWGNTDDVLFRLITLGSAALPAQGFERLQWGSVHGPMPPMGHTIKTADHLWKIIAFIRSINPPNSNPPEKLVPPRMVEVKK